MTDSDSVSITTGTDHQDDINDMSDAELYKLVQETIHANQVIRTETEMFEKYYNKVEPKDTNPTTNTPNAPLQQNQEQIPSSRSRRRVQRQRNSGGDDALLLTAEQKCDIASWLLDDVRSELEKWRNDSEKVIDTHKATLEEADLRTAEIKKAMYEFERDICKGALNSRTNKILAEKVIRYFEDKIKSRDVLMEKLRLKNASLKVQKKKVALQLRQKEEMGEVLHEVDFNQLKIENKQYLEKIDEKNQELLRLKLMAGNTLQILNQKKKRLHEHTLTSDTLSNDILSRKENLVRFAEETVSVEKERLIAEKRNIQLRKRLSDYRVPHVQEYVERKADLSELQKTVRSWERKVEIAQMALKTHKKSWQQIWTQNQQAWMQADAMSVSRIN